MVQRLGESLLNADTDYEILFRSRQLSQIVMTALKVLVCDYLGPRLWICPKMLL